MSLNDRLADILASYAACGQTVTYGELARALAIPGPGSVAKLTAALEDLMAEDAQHGRPLRAALCEGRLAQGLPAQGFFQKAKGLGRFDTQDPADFVLTERQRLWSQGAG